MKRLFILLLAVLLLISCFSACGSKNDETPTSEEIQYGETPTGRSDGVDEKTYVFYDGVLYVRDYGNNTVEGEDGTDFWKYSEKHQMTLAGRIEFVEEKELPSENFSALNAQVGDRLYFDERGNFILRRSDDYLVALVRVYPKPVADPTEGATRKANSADETTTAKKTEPQSSNATATTSSGTTTYYTEPTTTGETTTFWEESTKSTKTKTNGSSSKFSSELKKHLNDENLSVYIWFYEPDEDFEEAEEEYVFNELGYTEKDVERFEKEIEEGFYGEMFDKQGEFTAEYIEYIHSTEDKRHKEMDMMNAIIAKQREYCRKYYQKYNSNAISSVGIDNRDIIYASECSPYVIVKVRNINQLYDIASHNEVASIEYQGDTETTTALEG